MLTDKPTGQTPEWGGNNGVAPTVFFGCVQGGSPPSLHGVGYPHGYIHMDIHGVGYAHRVEASVRSNLANGRIAPRSRLCTLPIGPRLQ